MTEKKSVEMSKLTDELNIHMKNYIESRTKHDIDQVYRVSAKLHDMHEEEELDLAVKQRVIRYNESMSKLVRKHGA